MKKAGNGVSKAFLGGRGETFLLFQRNSLETAESSIPKQQGPEYGCLTSQEQVFMGHTDMVPWSSKGVWELSKNIRTIRKMESKE